jgi:hypothetical protein
MHLPEVAAAPSRVRYEAQARALEPLLLTLCSPLSRRCVRSGASRNETAHTSLSVAPCGCVGWLPAYGGSRRAAQAVRSLNACNAALSALYGGFVRPRGLGQLTTWPCRSSWHVTYTPSPRSGCSMDSSSSSRLSASLTVDSAAPFCVCARSSLGGRERTEVAPALAKAVLQGQA